MAYLSSICTELKKCWPDNKRITVVCHGHSIVCGYAAENTLKPLDAYPQLLLGRLADIFPHGVVSVITTAIGGENSVEGAKRFERDVLSHRPDIITIDYGRNDMFLSPEEIEKAWSEMTRAAVSYGARVILITPATDCGTVYYDPQKRKASDEEISNIIRKVAQKYKVGLADAHGAFEALIKAGHKRTEYMVSPNHINRKGHEIVTETIIENFDITGDGSH